MSRILITGGAGFIGVHAARAFSEKGWTVFVIDNLSRKGTRENLEWLQENCRFEFRKLDIRDRPAVESIIAEIRPDVLLHLAAQVAVTTSTENPREDFEINMMGTLSLLEGVRNFSKDTFFINASTNKVYGRMEDVAVVENNGRYEYADLRAGVDESQPLDFHSPYGCSKGAADQYTLDYARIYDLQSTSFRQSCIYGTRQFGMEDQGWVAWFVIATCLGKQIRIFGNGRQTRDILYVDDLVQAYLAAVEHADSASGQCFNIGGGPDNIMSLLELVSYLENFFQRKIPLIFEAERPGDQPVFICNIAKSKQLLEWSPKVSKTEGVGKLVEWTLKNKELVARISN